MSLCHPRSPDILTYRARERPPPAGPRVEKSRVPRTEDVPKGPSPFLPASKSCLKETPFPGKRLAIASHEDDLALLPKLTKATFSFSVSLNIF